MAERSKDAGEYKFVPPEPGQVSEGLGRLVRVRAGKQKAAQRAPKEHQQSLFNVSIELKDAFCLLWAVCHHWFFW